MQVSAHPIVYIIKTIQVYTLDGFAQNFQVSEDEVEVYVTLQVTLRIIMLVQIITKQYSCPLVRKWHDPAASVLTLGHHICGLNCIGISSLPHSTSLLKAFCHPSIVWK